jgi:YidC/Oxa1 family membrane protein insertase
MKSKAVVLFVAGIFLTLCGMLVLDAVRSDRKPDVTPLAAGIEEDSAKTTLETADDTTVKTPVADKQPPVLPAVLEAAPVVYPELAAVSEREETVTLGALYPEIKRTKDEGKYKFKVELTSLGAGIKTAELSEFDNRNQDNPEALRLLSPMSSNKTVYSLASTLLKAASAGASQFGDKALPLDRLNWKVVPSADADTATFETTLTDLQRQAAMLRLTKTYRIKPGSYDLVCELTAENLTAQPLDLWMQLNGPGGLVREDNREDDRKVVAAWQTEKAVETRLMSAVDIRHTEQEKIRPSTGFFTQIKNLFSKPVAPEDKLKLAAGGEETPFLWGAATNKYFTAIVRCAGESPAASGPVRFGRAVYYDASLMAGEPAENSGAGCVLETKPLSLAAAQDSASRKTLTFEMYMGPKDKSIFQANETYRKLEYFQTIDFRGCCCPTSMIGPMAFGIMWLMKTMYTLMGPLGNYGVVIIILVFVVRLLLHPVTKHSQVSMMKMQKLGPKMQEIQRKYADNKQEMNRKVMEMYREMGVSPVSGMLPMFLQMPIWIALWTAVYTSIDLRGQGFLPFWITDLSAPDHLFRLPFGLAIPYFGEYLNLLPLLMGAVMYAQQKLMPTSQASAEANPQMAQQQKMMMILMPLMFPLMLYHGPSGVNLYIMSSIGAGVIEQIVIRKHIREREEMEAQGLVPVTAKTGGKLKKKKPKPMFKFDKS